VSCNYACKAQPDFAICLGMCMSEEGEFLYNDPFVKIHRVDGESHAKLHGRVIAPMCIFVELTMVLDA
jgi:hypothetical protein